MKRRREQEAPQEPVVEEGGWWTGASTGAAALAVTVMRRGAWALLVAGPLLGGWALLSQPQETGRPAAVVRAPAGDRSGAGGFAEMFVSAYLRAGEGSQSELEVFYPDAPDLELAGQPGAVPVGQVSAVRVKEVADRRYWSVTVAARVLDPATPRAEKDKGGAAPTAAVRMRYFQVPVEAVKAGGNLRAVSLPSEVSAPPAVDGADLAYGPARSPQGSDPAVATLVSFLGSYLAGQGELGRYVSPGSQISPVSPAPYRSVVVETVQTSGSAVGDGQIGPPSGRERLRLVVQVRAERPDGVAQPLSYALTLVGRDGRWEIAAIDATPALNLPEPAAGSPAT